MIGRAISYFFGSAILSAVLCATGALLVYFVQGEEMALRLMQSWVIRFNGILVGAAGCGLLMFVHRSGRLMLTTLSHSLVVPDVYAVQHARSVHRATSWRHSLFISLPLTAIGGIVLWKAGFPMTGLSRIYLASATISVYWIASSILAFYIYTIVLFRHIEDHSLPTRDGSPRFRLNSTLGSMDLQTVDGFFIVSATLGVLAIYFGFRGTLTADFVELTDLFRKLMILPLILYLPATLCYSLYPRWVLRQISECDTLQLVEDFERETSTHRVEDFKANLELRAIILEIKEKMLNDRRAVPLLSLKDAPTLTMSIIIVIQFVAQKDAVVAEFLGKFFN
jgi:hypothetical protein